MSEDENAKTILGLGPPIARSPASDASDKSASAPPKAAKEKSGLPLDALDWELPDDLDDPLSDFDAMMAGRSAASSQPAAKRPDPADDSLPSTSALFGDDYRSADSDAPSDAHDDLPDETPPPDQTQGLVAEAAAPREEVTPVADAGVLDVELEPVTQEQAESWANRDTAPTGAVPVAVPRRSAEAAAATRRDTPVMTPRFEGVTPIVTSPVVAARQPTPAYGMRAPESPFERRAARRWRAAFFAVIVLAGAAAAAVYYTQFVGG